MKEDVTEMLELDLFRQLNSADNYVITMHSRRRMAERGIRLRDVMDTVAQGEIIEQYPEDFPLSCLILGLANSGRLLHVVVSLNEGHIYLITAYYPSEKEWEPDMRTRRVH